jgi:hypothetical protein
MERLSTYIIKLEPWLKEVTEALDKLGEMPASASQLEFNDKF